MDVPKLLEAASLLVGGDDLMPHCDSQVYNPARVPAVCKALEG
ncbi:hypothetical protein [Streptomyces sp. NPDC002386]